MLSHFELVEVTGQQNPAPRRAYPHVHIAVLQELVRPEQGGRRRGSTKIHATKVVTSADEVIQPCCPIHVGRPPPIPTA